MLCAVEFGSEAFDEFLEVLGSKVKMRGFSKYRAQLDNKSEELHIHIHILVSYPPKSKSCPFSAHTCTCT